MKRILTAALAALVSLSASVSAQNANTTASPEAPAAKVSKKRGPVFRATKEQIKQAQALLKGRGFYAGEETGKLDAPTREGLKKYQTAESLKVTGTLNAATLRKMNITLTEKQNAWVAANS